MSATKMLAVLLIIAGSLGLLYGGFSYTKETPVAKVGPVELSVNETKDVNISVWLGVGAIAAGIVLLFARK